MILNHKVDLIKVTSEQRLQEDDKNRPKIHLGEEVSRQREYSGLPGMSESKGPNS